MEKRTLKFQCLINMAMFAKLLSSGYLMNTNNLTLTGKFTEDQLKLATSRYEASLIETTEKVYSYEAL